MIPPPPRSTLFPYTTLFRSALAQAHHARPPDSSRLYAEFAYGAASWTQPRSEEHTSELQSRVDLVCRLLLEKKKINEDGLANSNCDKIHIRVDVRMLSVCGI